MNKNSEKTELSRRDFLRRLVLGGAAVGASLTFAPGISIAQTTQKGIWKMKYDCYIGKSAETAKLDEWFLDEIVKRSDGRIIVKKFWSGSLRKVGEHLSAVREGLSEISMIAWGYYLSDIPLSHGLEWYYRGCDHADSLLYVSRDMYNSFPELRKEWEETQKAKVLYFSNWSYCPFFMKEPLPDLESIKGKKIRGYGIGAETVNYLGGIGTPVVASEVYGTLEKNVLEGVFSFAFVAAEMMNLHQQAPYIVEGGAGAHAPQSVIMNLKLWQSLPDDLKEIISKTADDIYNWKYQELYSQLIKESVDRMVKKGAKFSVWSDSEIAKAAKLVQPAQRNKWIEDVAKPLNFDGEGFQNKIDELIKKYEPGRLKNPWEVYKANYLK